jgi:hypothetical protein
MGILSAPWMIPNHLVRMRRYISTRDRTALEKRLRLSAAASGAGQGVRELGSVIGAIEVGLGRMPKDQSGGSSLGG